jgi:hypothetical protein
VTTHPCPDQRDLTQSVGLSKCCMAAGWSIASKYLAAAAPHFWAHRSSTLHCLCSGYCCRGLSTRPLFLSEFVGQHDWLFGCTLGALWHAVLSCAKLCCAVLFVSIVRVVRVSELSAQFSGEQDWCIYLRERR